ncbi:hypothetical protein H9S92_13850 [Lewinella lacunae]|uniref:Uncharacterized protein n=4 Tax=Neolewinella lacunae TaxID=1517758 RepID=A0A923T956_9BACT|nr:hypothetical protein [Neolewinella lacunae]MBC6994834.1 hypothetical protein [Neolewinella lacunae]MBC6995199.1 hypothetical protein [Neolewinella lacunae]MBC6995258.1 hypothetical protein [Neolewinella lacunae]
MYKLVFRIILLSISEWMSKLFGQSSPRPKSILEQELEKRDPTKPIKFGHKCIWAAVKTEDTNSLLKALRLEKQRKANWVEGKLQARNGEIFVLPPIEGWILILGWGLPEPGYMEGRERAQRFLNGLSQKFGEAQMFGNFRGSGSAFWMKSVDGNTERLYYIGDGNSFIEGEPTSVEMKWDLIDTNSKDAEQEEYWEKMLYPDAEHVLEVAKAWSLNPMELEEKENVGEYGYLGRLKLK